MPFLKTTIISLIALKNQPVFIICSLFETEPKQDLLSIFKSAFLVHFLSLHFYLYLLKKLSPLSYSFPIMNFIASVLCIVTCFFVLCVSWKLVVQSKGLNIFRVHFGKTTLQIVMCTSTRRKVMSNHLSFCNAGNHWWSWVNSLGDIE